MLQELNVAIENRDVAYIKSFLQTHLDHGCLDKQTLSHALWRASQLDMVEIAGFILTSSVDVDVNYSDVQGRSVLCMGVKNGNVDMVKLLIENGAVVNSDADDKTKADMPIIHVAAEEGQCHVLDLLLRSGANVNEADKMGTTALHRAIKCNNYDVVKLLLDHGAEVMPSENFEMSPLCNAIISESPAIVRLLLQYGADPNIPDLSGMEMGSYKCSLLHTAQSLAASSSDVACEILQLLIGAGARMNVVDSYGYTPIQHCMSKASNRTFHFPCLKVLVEAGAKLESIHRKIYYKNYKPESSLLLLQCHGLWDAVRFLVEAGWELHREPCIDVVLEMAQERNVELYDVMRTLHLDPYPLSHLCRISIKRHLLQCTDDRSIYRSISSLPLPHKLVSFLSGVVT